MHDPRKQVAWVTAFGLALFVLTGRWSLGRLDVGGDLILLEPRTWTVIGLLALAYSPALARNLDLEPASRSNRGAIEAFLGFMTLSVLWAPSSSLPWTKAYEVVLVLAVVVSVTRIARWTGPRLLIDKFWDALALALGMMALLGLVSWFGNGGGERLAVLGGGPNTFGRNMSVLLMLGLAGLFSGRQHRSLWIAAAVFGAMLGLLSGSRGAILGMIGGGVTLVYARRMPLGRFVKIAIGVVVLAWFVVIFTDVGQSALSVFEQRFLKLTLEERHDAGRSEIYVHAWRMGLAAPLVGQGLAAFAVDGFHVYPHNIVLEAFCEGGLVGVGLLLAVLVPTLRRGLAGGAEPFARDLAVFVVFLMSSCFTGDLYDSRGVLLVALLISMHRSLR